MKKRSFPIFVAALALAVAAAGALFVWAVLAGRLPAAKTVHNPQGVWVELDAAWAERLTAQPTVQQMKQNIDQTVATTLALRANGVMLTGLAADGQALFRDGTGTLSTADAVTRSDKYLARFDPVQYLVRVAAAKGVEVAFVAAEADGTLLAEGGTLPEWLTALAARHQARVLQLRSQTEAGRPTAYALAAAADETAAALLRADESPAALAVQTQLGQTAHVCLGEYTALAADGSAAALYHTFAAGTLPDLTAAKGGKTVPQHLSITYPLTDGERVYTDKIFLMGTSDPNAPLTLNGETLQRGNNRGVWGVLVELAVGDNVFTLQNGDKTESVMVSRRKSQGGGSTKTYNDGTQPARSGQYLLVTEDIASALADPADASSIRQTLYKGAMAEVVASKRYASGNKLTFAYQLATGDWVRNTSCKLVSGSTAVLEPQGMYYDSAARSTVLTFAGGTPAVFHSWADNTLILQFLSAEFAGQLPALPEWITSAEVQPGTDSFALMLTFAETDPLYGWAINYDTNAKTTQIWLKRTPRLSGDASAPLAGVTVMLDAGHGGSDDGAMGSAGKAAPVEKDLNLAAATAAKYRLEQLGATVLMTRTDDSFPTLGDRVTAMNTLHPDLFIAVHHNSLELVSDINNAWGTEAYWFYDEGELLANTLVDEVCAATGRNRRSVNYGYYYVTRSNICPAVLLELGFMTNPSEYAECETDAGLWADGTAIAQAVYKVIAANG